MSRNNSQQGFFNSGEKDHSMGSNNSQGWQQVNAGQTGGWSASQHSGSTTGQNGGWTGWSSGQNGGRSAQETNLAQAEGLTTGTTGWSTRQDGSVKCTYVKSVDWDSLVDDVFREEIRDMALGFQSAK
jgi:hypothetical protein